MKAPLLLCLFMLGCRSSSTQKAISATERLPDQREYLERFKDDIVVLQCADHDHNTAPIAIGNHRYTLLHGWVYTNGQLSHTITGEGLTEGILIQDFPNRDIPGEYYKEDRPYIQQNLFRTSDSVWFMSRRYPIERENGDSIFSQLQPGEYSQMQWVFVGEIPARKQPTRDSTKKHQGSYSGQPAAKTGNPF